MNNTFSWRSMLYFDKMIAPTFLTILYYIHITLTVLASLWFVMKGMDTSFGGGIMVMSGLAGLVLGPFVIRLFYELLIVIFKIHTRLSSIDQTLRGQPATTPASVSSPMPATEPARTTSVPNEQGMPDFWAMTEFTPNSPGPVSSAIPVPPVDLSSLLRKMPNWPAALAAFVVLYAVFSPYATIGFGGSLLPAQLSGLSYSIKNSSLGMIVVLSVLVMLVTSAGGLKWVWFTAGYGAALLGSIVAFMDETSLFSQLSKAKSTMVTAGSTLGGFMPQADQFSQQMAQNIPSTSQFLTIAFYVFIITMLFLGYWALSGRYVEKGLL